MSNGFNIESKGLCRTCNNQPTCVFRKQRGFDAIFCEMFDDCVVVGGNGNGHRDIETVIDSELDSSQELKGLCVNCDNNDCCTLPKPEGGVWHCEEYC